MSFNTRPTRTLRSLALCAALLAVRPAPLAAQEKAASVTCVAAPGALLAKGASGWKAIRPGATVQDDTTVVSLFDATLRSASGVEVRLPADVGKRGPFPILESAVRLHADAKHDLASTPLRGLIVLTNIKKEGPATIQLSSNNDAIELTLKEPGAKLALEVYSRHAPGTLNLDDPKLDVPVLHLFFIALDGEAFLRHGDKGITLHAPPGPAILVWDSLLRQPEVSRLETLPDYVIAAKENDKKTLDKACAWAAKLNDDKARAAVLAEGAASSDALQRQAAVTAMGALDDLPALLGVLAGAKHADARAHAVLALRHWIGRAPGQTAKLHAALRKADYTDVQARSVLQLLYGFTPEQQRMPDTYALLIDYLLHSQPAVRELAHWHLVRLARAGRDIPYDTLAPEAERQRAVAQWRALVPAGALPSATKPAPN